MGIFDKVKDAIRIAKETNARIEEKNRLDEQARAERCKLVEAELRLYDRMERDKEYQNLLKSLITVQETIEEKYSIANAMNTLGGKPGEQLLELCEQAITLSYELEPKWKKYNQPITGTSAYKRAAMIHEKRGQYQSAADICLRAIKHDCCADGTNGGMRGRLARMIKKGSLELTDDMKHELLN